MLRSEPRSFFTFVRAFCSVFPGHACVTIVTVLALRNANVSRTRQPEAMQIAATHHHIAEYVWNADTAGSCMPWAVSGDACLYVQQPECHEDSALVQYLQIHYCWMAGWYDPEAHSVRVCVPVLTRLNRSSKTGTTACTGTVTMSQAMAWPEVAQALPSGD